jgi:hypothetical protein
MSSGQLGGDLFRDIRPASRGYQSKATPILKVHGKEAEGSRVLRGDVSSPFDVKSFGKCQLDTRREQGDSSYYQGTSRGIPEKTAGTTRRVRCYIVGLFSEIERVLVHRNCFLVRGDPLNGKQRRVGSACVRGVIGTEVEKA